jgi:succinate-acetate transporter protein
MKLIYLMPLMLCVGCTMEHMVEIADTTSVVAQPVADAAIATGNPTVAIVAGVVGVIAGAIGAYLKKAKA